MKQITGLIAWMILLVVGFPSIAQQSMTLEECINYGLENNEQLKNSRLDYDEAAANVRTIRAVGLPQINIGGGANYNFERQKSLLKADAFDPRRKGQPDDTVSFAQKYDGNIALVANQLLFDGSYFVGLQAASTAKELASKKEIRSKINVSEAISKAYYNALITQEQMNLLNANYARVDTLHKETKAMYKEGFVEKIDIDRIKVSKNNLLVEIAKLKQLQDLSLKLLKFQMGMDLNKPLTLADDLNNATVGTLQSSSEKFNYENRIEYQELQMNRELVGLDMKNNKVQYLPSLGLSFKYGWNTATSKTSNFFDSDRWLPFGTIGLNFRIPIFDGLSKSNKVQKNRIQLQKIENSMNTLSKSIDMEIERAKINLKSNLETLKVRKENVELAKEVYRISKIKYQEGVGSNIEVITADNSYKEAQVNYLNSLQEALISEISLKKATGTLTNN